MTVTRSAFKGGSVEEERQAPDGSSTGKQGAFPDGPAKSAGARTTGAGKGKRVVKKYGGKVAGAPSGLTTPGGALGHVGGDVKP